MTIEWKDDFICPYAYAEWNDPVRMRGHFEQKQRFAGLFRPKTLVEFGVMMGYGGLALCSHGAAYEGYDDEKFSKLRKEPPFTSWAKHLFYRFGVSHRIEILDTQTLSSVPTADLYHVDGDHSHEGTLHDLVVCRASMRPSSLILVDDSYDPSVNRACKDFERIAKNFGRITGEAGTLFFVRDSSWDTRFERYHNEIMDQKYMEITHAE